MDQREELKLHFAVPKSSERRYTAEVWYSTYSHPPNLLRLTLAKSEPGEGQEAIEALEGEQVEPPQLLHNSVLLIRSVNSRALKGPTHGRIGPKPDLGYPFESKAAELQLSSTFLPRTKTASESGA